MLLCCRGRRHRQLRRLKGQLQLSGSDELGGGAEQELLQALGIARMTVQGVLNAEQIEDLPVNGRNFLDLAQLEPGVQIQDGANFGKNGYSSISFGGRFGRTARIEVDGIDVSDEVLGTTTMNVPASGVQEFQLSQSSLDLSTELTTSGAINVITRSGANTVHGEAFSLFRRLASCGITRPAGTSGTFSTRTVWRPCRRADHQRPVLLLH
jgi:hypothetical protein